jgi:hypothetical protein
MGRFVVSQWMESASKGGSMPEPRRSPVAHRIPRGTHGMIHWDATKSPARTVPIGLRPLRQSTNPRARNGAPWFLIMRHSMLNNGGGGPQHDGQNQVQPDIRSFFSVGTRIAGRPIQIQHYHNRLGLTSRAGG